MEGLDVLHRNLLDGNRVVVLDLHFHLGGRRFQLLVGRDLLIEGRWGVLCRLLDLVDVLRLRVGRLVRIRCLRAATF